MNDWQKERQFRSLNEKKDERCVKLIRNGVETIIDIKEVVVGDIALLEPGEIVPCDGIFLSGHHVRCDESGVTGESDMIRKVPYSEYSQAWEWYQANDWDSISKKGGVDVDGHDEPEELRYSDCFVMSGSKVMEGYGSYVVIAVGTNSFNGRIMMGTSLVLHTLPEIDFPKALRGDTEGTPLQLKLNRLAELIAKLGSATGLLLFTTLMIRFLVQIGSGQPARTATEKAIIFVRNFITAVTLVVVAVPEGAFPYLALNPGSHTIFGVCRSTTCRDACLSIRS